MAAFPAEEHSYLVAEALKVATSIRKRLAIWPGAERFGGNVQTKKRRLTYKW
jgi:hypothetical protein